MQRIVIGHDGSAAADAALRWAERIAERAREVTIGRVTVSAGRPASDLAARCQLEGADLVVVGAHQPSGPAPWAGSTSAELATLADRPLVVVPAGWDRPLHHFVTGLDGSPAAVGAARWAADLALLVAARLHAVYAHGPDVELVSQVDLRGWAADAADQLSSWVLPLRATGLEVGIEVAPDHAPVGALNRAASRLDADLLVVGARSGFGGGALRVGGVAIQLLHYATRPLAIIPEPARAG